MGLIKELADLWQAEREKRKELKTKYRTEYAFTSGGTKYYQFADINNLPYERGLTALCVYNEVEMRCSREFLTQYTKAVEKILHDNKQIDVYKLNALNEVLKQRLELSADVDLLYKLASVVFFDKTENPAIYEQGYAEKKIAKWRKDRNVTDFFLQKPLRELMPFLQNTASDLDAYTELNKQLNEIHSSLIRTIGSTNE